MSYLFNSDISNCWSGEAIVSDGYDVDTRNEPKQMNDLANWELRALFTGCIRSSESVKVTKQIQGNYADTRCAI